MSYPKRAPIFLILMVLIYGTCFAIESKLKTPFPKNVAVPVQKVENPYFRVDAENPLVPLFSLIIYESGKVELGYLAPRDKPLEPLDENDTNVAYIKLRMKEKKQKAKFDSLEFREFKTTISNAISLFKNSFHKNGGEGESDFVISWKDEKNEVVSCIWVAPLSHEQAVFLKTIYNISFKKFPNKTARLLHGGVGEYTPSLLK